MYILHRRAALPSETQHPLRQEKEWGTAGTWLNFTDSKQILPADVVTCTRLAGMLVAEKVIKPWHSSQRHGHVLLHLKQSWPDTAEALHNQTRFFVLGATISEELHMQYSSLFISWRTSILLSPSVSHFSRQHAHQVMRARLPANDISLPFAFFVLCWDSRGLHWHARHFLIAHLQPQSHFRSILAHCLAGSQPSQ